MTVYLDIVFLENIIIDFIILVATGLISKSKINKLRLFLSSVLGGMYVIFSYITEMKIYSNIFLKITLSITMIYLAFLPAKIKTMLKQLIIFYLTSFTFGGVALALLYFIKPEDIFVKNGVLVGAYPLKIAILAGIVGFFVINLSFKIVKNKINRNNMFCNINIFLKEKTTTVRAIIDTGNLLKEPISGLPVIVVEKEKLEKLIPKEILNNVENILGGDISENIEKEDKQNYISRFRVIPFSSLGKQNGMLLGFKADKLIINMEDDDEIKEIDEAVVGIYNKKLTKNGKYSALIGLEMLER